MVTKHVLSPHANTEAITNTAASDTLTLSIDFTQKYPAKQHCRNVAARLSPQHTTGSSSSSNNSHPRALIYLPSARTTYPPYSDQPNLHRQLRHFYYLSGCPLADSHLTYDIAAGKLTLYIPPLNPKEVLWTGMPPSIDDCLATYNVDEVKSSSELREDLDAWVLAGRHASPASADTSMPTAMAVEGVIYCLDETSLPPPSPDKQQMDPTALAASAAVGWEWASLSGIILNTMRLRPAIDDCRAYKDAFEISLLRNAIAVTRSAHIAVQTLLRRTQGLMPELALENLTEADLEGVFRGTCVALHAKYQAYDPIVCTGRACSTLHYTRNSAPLGPSKQLLLIDAGAEWDCYAADITRTYPLNGVWTTEAKAVYAIVDRMQREGISRTVAGTPWRESHYLAARVATEGLLNLGVFTGGNTSSRVDEIYHAGTWRAFFPHGLGHMIGLECHDVEGTPDDKSGYDPHLSSTCTLPPQHRPRQGHLPLPPVAHGENEVGVLVNRIIKPGMVLTVEPGIYFCEWIIKPYLSDPKHKDFIDSEVLDRYWDVGGVRIEDMVLVLGEGEGNEVLSKHIPKGW